MNGIILMIKKYEADPGKRIGDKFYPNLYDI